MVSKLKGDDERGGKERETTRLWKCWGGWDMGDESGIPPPLLIWNSIRRIPDSPFRCRWFIYTI